MSDLLGLCAARHAACRQLLPALLLAFLAAGCAAERDGSTAREQRAAADPAALLRVAQAAEGGGDLSGAAGLYGRALALRPELGDAAAGLARARAGLGQPDEALAALRLAHARSPGDRRLTAILGRLEVAARQPAQALATFGDGLRQTPDDPELLTGQGVALDGLGRHGDAQASYRQALARDPAGIAARNNLALSLALSGQVAEAAGLLRDLAADVTARGSPAQVATVRDNLALVHGLSGNETRARQALGESMPAADLADNLRIYALLRDNLAGGPSGERGSKRGGKRGGTQGDAATAPAPAGLSDPAAGEDAAAPGEEADRPI